MHTIIDIVVKEIIKVRKGNESPKLTDPPMTLQEAQLFIREVLCEWFEQKYKTLDQKN